MCKESTIQNEHGDYCVALSRCSRILLSDDGAEVCLDEQTCKDGFFLATDGKYCVSTCGDNPWAQDKTTKEKKCVTTCPDTAPIEKDGACIICADATDLELPFWDGAKCVPCPETSPNLDLVTKTCVSACPSGKPVWTGFECVDCRTAYPLGDRPFWDPMSEKCVTSCSIKSPITGDTCQTCADLNGDSLPFWDPESGKCVAGCKETSKNGRCLPCDADEEFATPHWDAA